MGLLLESHKWINLELVAEIPLEAQKKFLSKLTYAVNRELVLLENFWTRQNAQN